MGLGTVGLPTALHISRFFNVVGYDIDPKRAEEASKFIPVESSIVKADVYVVAVSTGIKPDGSPDMSNIYDVCKRIAEVNKDGLVSIESTVAVGTCRDVARRFDIQRLVHCPHRYWKEDPIHHGVVQTRVLGGLNSESLELGRMFYTILGIPLFIASSIEVAELSKIAENSYRFVQIAFAEELKIICDELGLDFEEVRRACNTKWNIEILEARQGIGGHCLPKDIRYLIYCGRAAPLLNGAIKIDEEYRKWVKST